MEARAGAGAQATLTIDLGALVANWRTLAARVAPARCAAVVKADAYGLGLEPVARALARAGCATYFVAQVEEGVRLRAALPDAVVYVLNGFASGERDAFIDANLQPVLNSRDQCERWAAAPSARKPLAALHVDTGMNRLGLSMREADEARRAEQALSLVMSHFVAAEAPDDPRNAAQIAAFHSARALFASASASLANSSAIFLPQRPFYDLVRPGYALYGGNPTPSAPNPMRPVVRLAAPILQLRGIAAGETVGYNEQWTARRPSRIATIGVGYADGLPRNLMATDARPGGAAMLGGRRCPFAGRVSMDLITIDVTDAPEGAAEVGAALELIGPDLTIDEVGAAAGTIGYEVLTSLGPRYRRVYID